MDIRYSDSELEHLLLDLESDQAERKESYRGDVPDKVKQAICAFANDLPDHRKPGVLFIGAKDDGGPSHCPINDELLRTLADIKTDGQILPMPAMTVEKRVLRGAEMLVVTVLPSDMPPVKYNGRIWIRTGSRRALANAQEERILNEKRRYKDIPFDITPVSSATIAALSRAAFELEYLPAAFAPDVLEANGRSYEERLASCRMIVSPDEPVPTVLGILTLGRASQDFMPGAYVQFLRIAGTELADPVIDSEDLRGTFSAVLRGAEEKFKAHNTISYDIVSQPRHITSSQYPAVAFQQLIYNAVLHRSYENTNAPIRFYWFNDRIEIHSPGGPYGNVTLENFGRPGITDYRNPNIATVLRNLGYVQAFGRGIATAQRAMKVNGNPPLCYRNGDCSVVAIMARKSGHPAVPAG